MNNIFFLYISGSVNNNVFYWNEVKKIISKYSFIEYYLWNSKIYKANIDVINRTILNKYGSEGTIISKVASVINNYDLYNNNIVIITDG